MHRLLVMIAAVALGLTARSASASSPDPASSPEPASGPHRRAVSEDALQRVRAMDPRFSDLPTMQEVEGLWLSGLRGAPLLAGSWIRVQPPVIDLPDVLAAEWGYLDGAGRTVEVMLVSDCVADPEAVVRQGGGVDPCAWRHTWLYHVAPDETVSLVFEAGSPDDGRAGTVPVVLSPSP